MLLQSDLIQCHLPADVTLGMELSQLDFGAYPEAPRRAIYLQPTRLALRNDHFNKLVYLAGMDPWRFAGGAIKIVVMELNSCL